ncbi:TraR/DksA family transcriptional regulator [Pseudomonas quasicaspiana]|nr:TraR/DksA family transcriptional regulator [Pseudomonas quasicaspiana]
MADIADFANDLVQERLDQALAARIAFRSALPGHSLLYCESCDEPIPPARHAVMPGCKQCVICQTLDEIFGVRHAP